MCSREVDLTDRIDVIKGIKYVLSTDLLRKSTDSRLYNDMLQQFELILEYDDFNLTVNNLKGLAQLKYCRQVASDIKYVYKGQKKRWANVNKALNKLYTDYNDAVYLMQTVGIGDVLEVKKEFTDCFSRDQFCFVKDTLVKVVAVYKTMLVITLWDRTFEVYPDYFKLVAVAVE